MPIALVSLFAVELEQFKNLPIYCSPIAKGRMKGPPLASFLP
jgi:hypothetical protein